MSSKGTLVLVLVLVGAAGLLVVGTTPSPPAPPAVVRHADPSPVASATTAAVDTYSNIHPDDYVGPEACGECHEENYASWKTTLHSKMNANASRATVLGDFSGKRTPYADGYSLCEEKDGQYFMTVAGAGVTRRFRVTRVVGSRYVQMYIGVQVEGPIPPGEEEAYSIEAKLPMGYWFKASAWFPVTYFDSDYAREYSSQTGELTYPISQPHILGAWNSKCMLCHNTYAYELRLFVLRDKRVAVGGFPVTDMDLEQSEFDDRARTGLLVEDLVTIGISCESCHFGGREHAVEEKPIRFVPSSPRLKIDTATPELIEGARKNPYIVNGICAQCHCSPGVSLYPNGSGTWNSLEAMDLMGGSCASQIKCTDCHNPHVPGAHGGGSDSPRHLAACMACHEQYEDPRALAKHTRHPTSANVTCLDCHMPRIVQGLTDVIRTHRISSPTNRNMLAQAAPNACNLCHLDESIAWTINQLASGWGKTVSPRRDWVEAYGGSFEQPVGPLWQKHKIPIVRLVAYDAYGRSPRGREKLGQLLLGLQEDIAVNRIFAMFAVERVLGRKLRPDEYSPTAPPAVLRMQVELLRQTLVAPAAPLDKDE